MNQLMNTLFQTVFPQKCLSCDKQSQTYFCDTCLESLTVNLQTRSGVEHISWAVSLFDYEHPVIHALLFQLKFESNKDLGFWFGDYISKEIKSFANDADIWLPVPMYYKKERARGFNQVDVLFEHHLGKKYDTSILIRSNPTQALFELNPEQRKNELKDVFNIVSVDEIQGKRIGLIDDILTTGTTVSTLAELLIENGAKSVFVLTLSECKH